MAGDEERQHEEEVDAAHQEGVHRHVAPDHVSKEHHHWMADDLGLSEVCEPLQGLPERSEAKSFMHFGGLSSRFLLTFVDFERP